MRDVERIPTRTTSCIIQGNIKKRTDTAPTTSILPFAIITTEANNNTNKFIQQILSYTSKCTRSRNKQGNAKHFYCFRLTVSIVLCKIKAICAFGIYIWFRFCWPWCRAGVLSNFCWHWAICTERLTMRKWFTIKRL